MRRLSHLAGYCCTRCANSSSSSDASEEQSPLHSSTHQEDGSNNPDGTNPEGTNPGEPEAILEEVFEARRSLTRPSTMSSTAGNYASDEQSNRDETEDPESLHTYFQGLENSIYDKYRESGTQRRRWMEDANEPDCSIARSFLTFEQLEEVYDLEGPVSNPPITTIPDWRLMGLDPDRDCLGFDIVDETFVWAGFTALGLIIIEAFKRWPDRNGHNISEITQAIYTRDHPIESLKTVFVNTVVNEDTFPFIREHLYRESNGLSWPASGAQVWDVDRDEESFDMLLGTRIGKFVCYLVLGAFPRGMRRIARVSTTPAHLENGGTAVHMRFDVEKIA